jgi:peptidyl-dipeptidase A
MIRLESEINKVYNQFRSSIDGQVVNNNEIKEVLVHSKDLEKRHKAWLASKEIGPKVADKILELVHLRNEGAKKAGFSDYYAMRLQCDELDEEKMFATLGKLKDLTDEPFRQVKKSLDANLASHYGISPDDIRPWHYSDPFFQEVPFDGKLDLDQYFVEKDIEEITKKTFDSIGLEIRDILERSDLYPKEKKSQHAYCTSINRDEKDIRILCNITPSEYWAGTMLHEFGHGVYDKYIDGNLPDLLQSPAHILSTEAIAMLMDRLSKDSNWLVEFVESPEEEIRKTQPDIENKEYLSKMIFTRWALVMVYFERELYRNPDQNLNKLWWDCVEKIQYVRCPENRDEPDWATKIHIALAPVYYQNYLYGQMIASQLYSYIRSNVGSKKIFNNPELGKYLKEQYFASGATFDWNKTLAKATQEPLNIKFYLHDALHIS